MVSQKISPLTNSLVTTIQNMNAAPITHTAYYSNDVDATVTIPSNWKAVEVITFVSFLTPEGKIELRRNPTNFNTLEEYIRENDSKRGIKGEQERQLTVAEYPAVQRMEEFKGVSASRQKIYYLFVNKWIYTVYSNDQALFDDLDKIAYSFKYTP